MNPHGFFEVLTWLVIASIIVLIVMNAKPFATAIGSIGMFVNTNEALYTGSWAKAA